MVAERVAWCAAVAVPDMPSGAQPPQQRGIAEAVVEPKAVTPVGRVPGVFASMAVQGAECVHPAGACQFVDPALFASIEGGRFLVDTAAAAVFVAYE